MPETKINTPEAAQPESTPAANATTYASVLARALAGSEIAQSPELAEALKEVGLTPEEALASLKGEEPAKPVKARKSDTTPDQAVTDDEDADDDNLDEDEDDTANEAAEDDDPAADEDEDEDDEDKEDTVPLATHLDLKNKLAAARKELKQLKTVDSSKAVTDLQKENRRLGRELGKAEGKISAATRAADARDALRDAGAVNPKRAAAFLDLSDARLGDDADGAIAEQINELRTSDDWIFGTTKTDAPAKAKGAGGAGAVTAAKKAQANPMASYHERAMAAARG